MSALKHLNLCPRDTVSLRRYHSESLWRIWGGFLRGLSGVLACNESALSTDGIFANKDFVEYVEQVQAESGTSSNVIHA
jgi:hypothetical protein